MEEALSFRIKCQRRGLPLTQIVNRGAKSCKKNVRLKKAILAKAEHLRGEESLSEYAHKALVHFNAYLREHLQEDSQAG